MQYYQMKERTEAGQRRGAPASPPGPSAERETGKGGLADQIAQYCAGQHPRWVILSARTDVASTLPLGAHDMTVFLPGGRVLCVELKSRTGKRTREQLAWGVMLAAVGHAVHECRSLEQFIALACDGGTGEEVRRLIEAEQPQAPETPETTGEAIPEGEPWRSVEPGK